MTKAEQKKLAALARAMDIALNAGWAILVEGGALEDAKFQVMLSLDFDTPIGKTLEKHNEFRLAIVNDIMEKLRMAKRELVQMNPYPYEHAARILPPNFDIYRRKNVKNGTIGLIFGKKGNGPMKLQAVRFRAAFFTVAQARAWLKKHKITATLEAATGTRKEAWKREGVRAKKHRVKLSINQMFAAAGYKVVG